MITLWHNENGKLTQDTNLTFMKFPGGENHIKMESASAPYPTVAYITGANLDDYMVGALWADIAQQRGIKTTAVIPYLPGARADRGEPFGAKTYAAVIDAAGYDRIVCFDPHSPVMPSLINTPLTVIHSSDFIPEALKDEQYVGVIAPDKGAVERAMLVSEKLGVPLYKAEKVRDFETGKLSGFTCEPVPTEGNLLVVDDICDGGYTFVGLAGAINTDSSNLDLWVSHGVFSGNAPQLNSIYRKIHTTDSHPGASREEMKAEIHSLLNTLL